MVTIEVTPPAGGPPARRRRIVSAMFRAGARRHGRGRPTQAGHQCQAAGNNSLMGAARPGWALVEGISARQSLMRPFSLTIITVPISSSSRDGSTIAAVLENEEPSWCDPFQVPGEAPARLPSTAMRTATPHLRNLFLDDALPTIGDLGGDLERPGSSPGMP